MRTPGSEASRRDSEAAELCGSLLFLARHGFWHEAPREAADFITRAGLLPVPIACLAAIVAEVLMGLTRPRR